MCNGQKKHKKWLKYYLGLLRTTNQMDQDEATKMSTTVMDQPWGHSRFQIWENYYSS